MSANKTLNILFDSWSAQVLFQQAAPNYPTGANYPKPTGMRLNTLLGAMKSIGLSSNCNWNVSFTNPPITAAQLAGIDVYVSLTRYQGTGFAYQAAELTAIENWVKTGGNILLMSNHGDFSLPVNSDNWTANDIPLAALFGVTLENYSVQQRGNKTSTSDIMSVKNTIPYLANQAPTMTAHNSCIIIPPSAPATFTSIVEFPSGWNAYCSKTNKITAPPTPYFSILVPYPGGAAGAGQMLVMGNSGWTGDYGSPSPACGQIPMQNNLMFVLNCIGYLAGLRQVPATGQCPSAAI